MTAGWFALMAGGIAALLGILTAGVRTGRVMHRRITDFLDDWAGQPQRPGVAARPGVMARLEAVEETTADISQETKPNHGHSMRDIVHQTSTDLAGVKADVAALRGRTELFEHERHDREDPA
jgi:hypothetical protein